VLVCKIRILVDPYERAASKFKIFDHELAKTVFRVIHLIVEDEGKVETFIDKSHEFINSIRINVAQYTFRIKEGG